MDLNFKLKGNLSNSSIIEIFSNIIKSGITDCTLGLSNDHFSRNVWINGGKIKFIYSDSSEESFYTFLSGELEISGTELKKAKKRSEKEKVRLGRACTDLKIFGYNELWGLVKKHQKWLMNRLYVLEKDDYSIEKISSISNENITIEISVEEFILTGIRQITNPAAFHEKFEMLKDLYIVKDSSLPSSLEPFELHILNILKKYPEINKILEISEMNEDDTLKYLYYFYLIGVLSDEKIKKNITGNKNRDISVNISFSSYEEAIKHYNTKYEMIFKILSKEIGPVALSILSNSIDDIRENLPVFLRIAEIGKDGKLIEQKILKKVWYHDFESHSSEFVRGLEELLYAQIYAVKKNLGIEYEHQILRWLKGTKN